MAGRPRGSGKRARKNRKAAKRNPEPWAEELMEEYGFELDEVQRAASALLTVHQTPVRARQAALQLADEEAAHGDVVGRAFWAVVSSELFQWAIGRPKTEKERRGMQSLMDDIFGKI